MRDIVLEETVYLDFTTRAFATGIPGTLGGTPVLSVLEENNATPITSGVSVSVDRASVAGLNMATIVATAANGYENGKGYSVYISTGTVGGVSVIGEIVAQFTIGASAAAQDLANGTDGLGALKTAIDDVPTTAEFEARTLVAASYFDPAADAVANVTLCATTTALTNVINAASIVASVSGNVDGSVDSVTGDTKQTADHTAAIADIPTVAEFNARTLLAAAYFDPAADAVANVTLCATTTALTNVINAASIVASVSGNVDGSVDSVTGDTKQTADHTAGIADIPTVAEFNARTLAAASYFDPAADTVATVTTVTGGATSAAQTTAQNDLDKLTGSDGATLATAQGNYAPAKAADILTTALTESYAADGAAATLTQLLYLIQQALTEFAIAGTTTTVKKLDGSTTAATMTLDDATNPTSSTRAT